MTFALLAFRSIPLASCNHCLLSPYLQIIQRLCRPNGFLNMSPQSTESGSLLLREFSAQFSHKAHINNCFRRESDRKFFIICCHNNWKWLGLLQPLFNFPFFKINSVTVTTCSVVRPISAVCLRASIPGTNHSLTSVCNQWCILIQAILHFQWGHAWVWKEWTNCWTVAGLCYTGLSWNIKYCIWLRTNDQMP